MNKNSFTFKKVTNNEIDRCCNFIKKNLKIKITNNFYKWRYASNGSCAFIAKSKNKIVGHVGFTKYKTNIKEKNLFSRHSSCIALNYRRLGIYSSLIDFSFKYLKKKTNLISLWPNNLNQKTSKKIKQKKIKRKFIFFLSQGSIRSRNKLEHLKKYIQISKYIKFNDVHGIVLKDKSYYKWRYFSKYYADNQVYIYKLNKSIFLFFFNEIKKELNLLDYIGNKSKFYKNLSLVGSEIRFNFWALNNSLLELKLSKIGFKKKNKTINNELVFLKKENINDKDFFYMSDTDSFITLR